MQNFKLEWIRQSNSYNTVGSDTQPSIVADSDGNTYIAFRTSGTVPGGTNKGNNDIAIAKLDKNGNLVWVKQNPAWNTNQWDESPSIKLDSTNNIIFAYHSGGQVVGGTFIGAGGIGTSGDIVFVKLDNNGNLLWVIQNPTYNTTIGDYDPRIAIASDNSIYFTYHGDGQITGGTKFGNFDVIVGKLSSTGTKLWEKQTSQWNTSAFDFNPTISLDKNNNPIIAFWSGGGVIPSGTGAGAEDIIIMKFDTAGNLLWAKQNPTFNTSANEFYPSVSADYSNNIVVAYQTFGQTPGQVNSGSGDIALLKLDSDGNRIWIKQTTDINNNSTQENPFVFTDDKNDIYLLFTSFYLQLAKYDACGNFLWLNDRLSISNTNITNAPNLTVDYSGNLFFTFHADGRVGGIPASVGSNDIIVGKLNSIYANDVKVKPTNVQVCFGGYNYYFDSSFTYLNFNNYYYKLNSTSTNYYELQTSSLNNTLEISSEISYPTGLTYISPDIEQLVNFNRYTFFKTIPDINRNFAIYAQNIYSGKFYQMFQYNGPDIVPLFLYNDKNNMYISTVETDINNSNLTTFYLDLPQPEDYHLKWIVESPLINTPEYQYYQQGYVKNDNIYITYSTDGQIPGGTARIGDANLTLAKLDKFGKVAWTAQNPTFGSNSTALYSQIVVDNSENVYVSYTTTGRITGGTNIGGYDLVVIKLDLCGNLVWAKQNPQFNSSTRELVTSITLDRNENPVVVYQTFGKIGGGTKLGSPSEYDLAVLKLNKTNGSLIFVVEDPSWNSIGNQRMPSVQVDSSNNIFFSYTNINNLIPGGFTNGGFDIVVVKLDSNGNKIWAKQDLSFNTVHSTGPPLDDWFSTLRIDSEDNIIVAYQTVGVIEGQNNGNTINNIVLFKLNNDGNLQWVKQEQYYNQNLINTYNFAAPFQNFMSIDGDDNIIVTYTVDSNILGGTYYGNYDIVVLKFNYNGQLLWATQNYFNTPQYDYFPTVHTDEKSNIYVTYLTEGVVPGGTHSGTIGIQDMIVVAKFGPPVWYPLEMYSNNNDDVFFGAHSYYRIYSKNYIKMYDNQYHRISSNSIKYLDLENSSKAHTLFYLDIPFDNVYNPQIINPTNLTPIEVGKYDYYRTPDDVTGRYIIYAQSNYNDDINYYQVFQEGNSFIPIQDPSSVLLPFIQTYPVDVDPENLLPILITCFLEGQKVLTKRGYIEVENITSDDVIITHDNKLVKIKNIHKTTALPKYQNLPVCIPSNFFSKNYPSKNVYISQAHKILVGNSWVAPIEFPEYIRNKIIMKEYKQMINYYHIELFDINDSIITDGGLIVESYNPSFVEKSIERLKKY